MAKGQAARWLVTAVVVILVAGVLVVLVPRLTHHCDNCDTFFFGTGYYANDVSNVVTSLTGQEDKILCEECATQEHALAIAFGKTVDEFKRPLFND